MPSFTYILVAALAAGASVHALPQSSYSILPTPASTGAPIASSAPINFDPAAAPEVVDPAFAQLLETQPTAIDKFKKLLLGADGKIFSGNDLKKRTVFDFNAANATGKGGRVLGANVKNFPILTDLGISTTVAFLGACGINTPHIHPRATEFLTVVDGSIDFGYILENGLVDPKVSLNNEVAGTLNKFQGTVFPMGSIHYQVNNDCKPATFVAALNSADPGTSQIAQNFFGLNADVVNATLGFPKTLDGKDIESFRATIPLNLALGIDKCLTKCGIPKN